MRTFVTVFATLTLATFCSKLGAHDSTTPSVETVEETTKLIFFDDFSEGELDRTKWNVRTGGRIHNDEQQTFFDSKDTLQVLSGDEVVGAKAGALQLKACFQPGSKTTDGRSVDFISSRINTRGNFEFTYGELAARIKLPPGDGIWPAFWALGTGGWPATGEIDVMEYVGETDWFGVALHGPGYSGNTPFVNLRYLDEDSDATNWHVYSAEWTSTKVVFKVDGQTAYRVTRPMVERHGEWVFDSPKFLILNVAMGGSYPYKINRVKKPYLGIPESTVQLVKDGKAKMLVDWVRVTQPKAIASPTE